MAKFTKTTEIDISAMHEVIEEETPKKSKWMWILSLIISIILAFIVWIYVTETSKDEHTKTYENVAVANEENGFVDVIVTGTYSEFADLEKTHIIVTKNNGEYVFSLKPEAPITLKPTDLVVKD